MFSLAVPWWELVVRSIIVYVVLLFALRLTGKRHVGQLAPFDLVLLLILSNAVQNAMTAGDNSLIGGLLAAMTLILLNAGMSRLSFRSKKFEAMIEGRPQVLIHNGNVYGASLADAQLTHHELAAALRDAGCMGPHDVLYAVLETNGSISVIPKKSEARIAKSE